MINPVVFKAEMLFISSLTPKQDKNKKSRMKGAVKVFMGSLSRQYFPLFSKVLSSTFYQSLLSLRGFYLLTAKSDQDRISS